jgi:hypothetical protein
MRTLIRWLAAKAGYSTSYHVAATYNRDSHVVYSILSMTVSVRPWIHRDNYADLVAYVKTQATGCVGEPNITGLTKLGA